MLSENEITLIKKKIVVQYMYGIIIVLSLFTFYYFYADIKPLNFLFVAVLISHIVFFYIFHKFGYEIIKSLIPLYFVYLAIFLYLNILFFLLFKQITAFFWCIIFPIGIMIFFKKKTVILGIIFLFMLMGSIFIVKPFIPEGLYSKPPDDQLNVINIMSIILIICFILFFIYYQMKIYQIKRSLLLNDYKTKEEKYINDTENVKLDNLYTCILNYFSEKKPYCNPDFSIIQLAEDLGSNAENISKAIKIKANVDFTLFLNKYRINLVKEMISKNYHNKYTFEYIYNMAGFKHQPVFNKTFKEIEGITPSEYIKIHQGHIK